ncbi:MAG: hypothetical protein RLZZ450_2522 [Pseudomonadota bacterium]|jgi:glutamate/tyrosine decarboxylase-like PLP-dependent enzyme
MDYRELLAQAHVSALDYCTGLGDRKVAATASTADLLRALGGAFPEHGQGPTRVLTELIAGVEPGLVHSAGPRYFGFVIGGSLPVAVAADWMTSAWDQNAFGYVLSPAASVVEQVTSRWLLDALHLPASASVGFVTGGQLANFTCLCAARDAVLSRAGVDVARDGLADAHLTVFVGEQGHSTIYTALRLLGIGQKQVVTVAVDAQGRLSAASLREALAKHDGPAIVCAQAGNVSTGAFDPFVEIVEATRARGAWLHVDGAFGLWAAAVPALRGLLEGVEGADSWAVDAHKWLNVPYDSGLAIVADASAHQRAMGTNPAAYLVREAGEHDGSDWAPESSRRARAFAIYAVLRCLGRDGLADLIARGCSLARTMAARLTHDAGAIILNDVVLNQVLARFTRRGSADHSAADIADGDAVTSAVIERVQREGVCWVGPSRYMGRVVMRVSVSNWSTTERDIALSVASIARAATARD